MNLFAFCPETFSKIRKPLWVVLIIVLWGAGLIGIKLTASPESEQAEITAVQKQKEDKETFEQCRKEAEAGAPAAQYELSIMYASGEGAERNEAKSDEWCQKAAAAGHPEAQIDLGFKYYTGNHGTATPDYAKAFEWYQKAANSGNSDANYRVGVMYLHGEGVTKNDVKAFGYLLWAAEYGHRLAKYKVGWMYENGQGVAKDARQAAFWYNSLNKRK